MAAIYDSESVSVVRGGQDAESLYHGSVQFDASFNLEHLLGWHETTAFVYGMILHGRDPGAAVGSAQNPSSISGPAGGRIDEAWIQRNAFDSRLSLLAGRYDVNSEFYRLRSAGLFLNSSFGVGPEFSQSGPAGLSAFPATAFGVRAAYKATPEWVVRSAALDAKPYAAAGENARTMGGNGALLVVEGAHLSRPGAEEPRNQRLRTGRLSGLPPYEDKVALGLWHYTARFEDLSEVAPDGSPAGRRGSSGVYALVDHLFTSTRPRTSAFMQVGIGDARVNRFGRYLGFGIDAYGPTRGRPDDEIGIAIAIATNGSHWMKAQEAAGGSPLHAETIVELAYLAQLSKGIALQPDLQYVIHPGTVPEKKNALAALLRFEVAF